MANQTFDWGSQSVIVTGGGGFVGQHIVEHLEQLGAGSIFVPRRRDFDLREKSNVVRLYRENADATMVIHLAATVGGIGANRKYPGTYFYDNLMMGTLLLEQARMAGIPKFVGVGTICSYPKITPIPFQEDDLWNGYPEETNAPYGLAKKMLLVQGQAYRAEFGYNAIHLLPTNVYGPCFSGDTEILTVRGVKNVKYIEVGEKIYTLNPKTFSVEISRVVAVQRAITNEFFNFRSQTVDFRVTPDHKIFYRTVTGFQKRQAGYFRSRAGKKYGQIVFAHHNPIQTTVFPTNCFSLENFIDEKHVVNKEMQTVQDYNRSTSKPFSYIYDLRDWIEFLGWYISEGSISLRIGQLRITQHAEGNQANHQQIKSLLERMGIPFGYDEEQFYFTSRLFRNFIESEIGVGSANKRIPGFVFHPSFPKHLRQLLFETLMLGDGHKNRLRYVTKSVELKNDMLHLCFLLGYKTVVYKGDDNCWRINIRKIKKNSTVKYKNISIEQVNGEEVFCLTTQENHIIYAGRNGKFNWIGQCDNFDPETSHVIPAIIRKMAEAKKQRLDHATLFGDGSPTREFLYVKDAAEGIALAAAHYDSPEPVNLGSGFEISIKDLAETIAGLVGFEGEIRWDTSKPNGQPRRRLDVSRAEREFGFRATTRFEDGLRETVAWYQAQQVAAP